MKDTTFFFNNFEYCAKFEILFSRNLNRVVQKMNGVYFIQIGFVVPKLWPLEKKTRVFNIALNARFRKVNFSTLRADISKTNRRRGMCSASFERGKNGEHF